MNERLWPRALSATGAVSAGTHPRAVRFPPMSALRTIKSRKEIQMRTMLIAGAAGLVLAAAAGGAADAHNANVPIWSPLSINTNLAQPMHRYRAHGMSEGRAAYVQPENTNQIFSDGSGATDRLATPEGDNNSGAAPNTAPMADR
jgi:hypothetical protein